MMPDLLFQALADPTRRAIFERLAAAGELNVRALTQPSGISQPGVSKHLRVLKQAGLVDDRAAGRETFYRARPAALLPLIDWLGVYGAFWAGKFDALEQTLKRMDQ